ncbi:MAG TPA: hypothetical protein DCR93_17725 [Cytophagales bacterium]|nr:hypothetical protein [Cytophagales bacterium]HAP61251.1 hypothetical protein [Cytophagales bacterium]
MASIVIATPAKAQRETPSGLTNGHWQSIQDFWQYQARSVKVTKMDDTLVEGLLLVAGMDELWVLPNTYWVLEDGDVLKIPIEDIKTIQLRKNPRILRAATLGYLRTAIWATPPALAVTTNDVNGLALLITLGIAAPMGIVFNSVYHGLVTVPYKNYRIYGQQDLYMTEAYPWMSRYTLLAQPEEYLQLDREIWRQNPNTWNGLYDIIPSFKTLFAPNLVSVSFGYHFPFWSLNQQETLNNYLSAAGQGIYEYSDFSSNGGFSLGIGTDVAPRWSVGVRSILGFVYDGAYWIPGSDTYLSHELRLNDVAVMAGYYILPPDPYLKRLSSLEAQVGLGAIHSHFILLDYDPITQQFLELGDPQWGGGVWGGLQYAIRAHRWLYFKVGAHSRLTTPLELPALDLPMLPPGQGLMATDLPTHQFQFTFQAAIMLHRPAKWAQSKN